ncbi:MAG: hypothetical protein M3461_18035 [Pseudomonadota bacterium]|nr:hypothetical protein [Pseudomonadota bacterium]
MEEDAIEAEVKQAWRSHRDTSPSVRRINVRRLLFQAECQAKRDIAAHLSLGVDLLLEALQVLMQLRQIQTRRAKRKLHLPNLAFWLLVDRQIGLVCSIYRLITNGLDEPARVLGRTLLETTELSVAVLYDTTLAEGYASDEDYDANQFWVDRISRGKVTRLVKTAMMTLDADEEMANDLLALRRDVKQRFSGSVHSSFTSSFHSSLVVSLSSPGRLATNTLGHVSAFTPSLCAAVIHEVHFFVVFVVRSILKRPNETVLSDVLPDEAASFMVAAVVFQNLVQKYEQRLHDVTDRILDEL